MFLTARLRSYPAGNRSISIQKKTGSN